MNKQDLIDEIAQCAGLTPAQARRALECHLAAITGALRRGEDAAITGFGSFSAVKRPARLGRNPATGEAIKIPAKTVVRFKPGKTLRESVQ